MTDRGTNSVPGVPGLAGGSGASHGDGGLGVGARGSRRGRAGGAGTTETATQRGPSWIDRACIVIPALDAEGTLTRVVEDLRNAIPERAHAVLVIDDGSRDGTAALAVRLGCQVVSHGTNRGKGAALRTGFATALAHGWDVVLSVDADGQHVGDEARRIMFAADDPGALVLGVRNLERDGAPRANRFSNAISNHFLSRFTGQLLRDTQCGLRRYPARRALALSPRGEGYDFEAEVVLRAVYAGITVVQEPVRVLYPENRRTHFHVARDPWRIIRTVLRTVGEQRLHAPRTRRSGPR